MLACLPCASVPPPSWFPIVPIGLWALVVAGLVVALVVTARPGRNETVGVLLIVASLVVLGGAVLTARSARTSVAVATTPLPPDGPWNVTCESALQRPAGDSVHDDLFTDACTTETTSERTQTYLLLGASGILLVAGAVMLGPGPVEPATRRRDEARDADVATTA